MKTRPMSSPKTTTIGWLLLGRALLLLIQCIVYQLDDDKSTVADWNYVGTMLFDALVGLGFLSARDNNRTSEDVGLK